MEIRFPHVISFATVLVSLVTYFNVYITLRFADFVQKCHSLKLLIIPKEKVKLLCYTNNNT